MDIAKLAAAFVIIILVQRQTRSLFYAVLSGTAATVLLFGLNPVTSALIIAKAIVKPDTLMVILTFYGITFLQRMLEKRGHLRLAERSLDSLFNNRRINASVAPMFIGLLPSAGAITICGPIVEAACGDYLSTEEKTFVTSYYRHIPESFLPTYSSILIAISLSGVKLSSFILGMLPMIALLFSLGFVFYLRKVPKNSGQQRSAIPKADVVNLVRSLWTIVLTIVLILGFGVPVYAAVLGVIVLCFLVNRFSFKEIEPMFRSAFEAKLILSTVAIMAFKDILAATGVINTLPATLSVLPIPDFLVFALIFFVGSIISGSTAIIAICMPIAFAAIPNAGMPLLVLLMCCSYAAMQVSPTHICLAIVTEYFGTSFNSIIAKTLPVISCFICAAIGYYLILSRLAI